MSFVLQPPIKVSPIIKLARWTSLVTGVIYGSRKLAFYRAYDRPLKIKRDLENKLHAEEIIVNSKLNFISVLNDIFKQLGFDVDMNDVFK